MSISPIEHCSSARAYLERIGAEMRTLFTAAVKVNQMGYDKDVARIRFRRDGSVRADYGYEPTATEMEAIAKEVSAINFPVQETVKALSNGNIPPMMLNAESKDMFIYRNRAGDITFVQVRIDLDNGDKRYVPHTYWSDGVWRNIEPENGLPIYNLESVEKGDRVFLHEGAKAAKAAIAICEDPDHPWSEYFRTGVHVGWIGGVHHIGRTRWGDLTRLPGELIIVPDNDFIGRTKVSQISAKFECPVMALLLDYEWPKSWDVADPIPEKFFAMKKDQEGYETRSYIGPDLDSLIEPCDWATEEVDFGDAEPPKQPVYKIREVFAQSWVRIQNLQHYAHLSRPEITLNKDQFNIAVRAYSNVADTSGLLAKISGNIVDKVTFMPSKPTGLIRIDGEHCLNQYVDHRVKPMEHDGSATKPFHRFMEYLFPEEEERTVVYRWMATLYARPDTRMGFGMLFLSKLQGVGKSTLLNLMAQLIGVKHASFPGDSMIQSDFNGWVVNKRLVVVHEIYAGQNWKTYNRLKSLVTENVIEANNKHVANYSLPNWSHFAAASNSMEALRIENDDRRWYVPRLPTVLYEHYEELYLWIKQKGVRYLAYDLLRRNDYLTAGDVAPHTASKAALIDQSMPTDERMIVVCAERLPDGDCMDVKEVWLWLQNEASLRAFVSPQRIAGLLKEHNFFLQEGIRVAGRPRQLMWKSEASMQMATGGLSGDELEARIAGRMRAPYDVFKEQKVM